MNQYQGVNVLIIDDDKQVQLSLSAYLEDRQFNVYTANNGRIGLTEFLKNKIDLVMVDLRMPEMDGHEVIAKIREVNTETPIIVISGAGSFNDAILALRNGAQDYLVKPIHDMGIVLHAIDKSLERVQLLRDNARYQKELEQLISIRTKQLKMANDELRNLIMRLKIIVMNSQDLSSLEDQQEAARRVLEEFAEIMAAEGGAFYYYTPEKLLLGHSLEIEHTPKEITIPLKKGSVFEYVLRHKEPLLIEDINREAKFSSSGWDKYRDNSLMVCPLLNKENKPVAIISLHNKKFPPFSKLDREMAGIMATFTYETIRATTATVDLQRSEERYQSILQHLSDIILVVDESLTIKFATPSIEKILGYSADEMVGLNGYDFVHVDYMDLIKSEFEKAVRKENKYLPLEFKVKHKDGTWIYIEAIAISQLDNQQINGVIITARNITERKNAEKAIIASEKKYRNIFENIRDVYFETNPDGTIIEISPSIKNILNYRREELIQKPITTLFVNAGKWADLLKSLKTREFITNYELVLKDNEELEHVCSINSQLVRDDQGILQKISGTIRDETERNHLEQQLQQAQKMESIGTLAGGIAHDFNNLLTVINGHAEIALMKLDENHPAYIDNESILHTVDRAVNLTNQILAFSRKQVYEAKNIDLNKVIHNLEKMLRRLIDESLSIEMKLNAESANIKADPGQIGQIIMNLVLNARDAIRERTDKNFVKKITISTENVHWTGRETDFSPIQKTENYISIIIKDTGMGMSEEVQQKIYEPFFTTKETGKGTGLGLSTVYGIIRQHGGDIKVESVLGKGTTFRVFWPLSEDSANVDEITANKNTEIPKGTGTILLVEDDEGVRSFACIALEQLGYQVHEACNGQEALEILGKLDLLPDLVITDLVMPIIDGKELGNILNKQYPQIKILYMSGYADSIILQDLEKNPNIFIHKPFTINDFGNKVRNILKDN